MTPDFDLFYSNLTILYKNFMREETRTVIISESESEDGLKSERSYRNWDICAKENYVIRIGQSDDNNPDLNFWIRHRNKKIDLQELGLSIFDLSKNKIIMANWQYFDPIVCYFTKNEWRDKYLLEEIKNKNRKQYTHFCITDTQKIFNDDFRIFLIDLISKIDFHYFYEG